METVVIYIVQHFDYCLKFVAARCHVATYYVRITSLTSWRCSVLLLLYDRVSLNQMFVIKGSPYGMTEIFLCQP